MLKELETRPKREGRLSPFILFISGITLGYLGSRWVDATLDAHAQTTDFVPFVYIERGHQYERTGRDTFEITDIRDTGNLLPEDRQAFLHQGAEYAQDGMGCTLTDIQNNPHSHTITITVANPDCILDESE